MVAAEYPAIVRFDFAFWIRTVTASSIRSHMEKVLSCVAFKSAVDVTKLEFNDFLTLYGPILNEAFGDDKTKIKSMIEESKDIYKMLRESNDCKLTKSAIIASPEEIEAINQQLMTLRTTGAQNKVKQLDWTDDQSPLEIVMNSREILSRTAK